MLCFTGWLLLTKPLNTRFASGLDSVRATCVLRAITHIKLIDLTVLDHPSVLISLGNTYSIGTVGTSTAFPWLYQFCFEEWPSLSTAKKFSPSHSWTITPIKSSFCNEITKDKCHISLPFSSSFHLVFIKLWLPKLLVILIFKNVFP